MKEKIKQLFCQHYWVKREEIKAPELVTLGSSYPDFNEKSWVCKKCFKMKNFKWDYIPLNPLN